jgi:hypothetical protein
MTMISFGERKELRAQWIENPDWRELVLAQALSQLTFYVIELLGQEQSHTPPGSERDDELDLARAALLLQLQEMRVISGRIRIEHDLNEDSDPDGLPRITFRELQRQILRSERDYVEL